jgi:hypothetical protein
MNGRRRVLGSSQHGSMANAMAKAVGVQAAFPQRQVVSLSGDDGFTMLMGARFIATHSKIVPRANKAVLLGDPTSRLASPISLTPPTSSGQRSERTATGYGRLD